MKVSLVQCVLEWLFGLSVCLVILHVSFRYISRMQDRATRYLNQMKILQKVGREFASLVDLPQLLQAILDSAMAIVPTANAGTIHFTDESRGQLMPKAASHRQFVAAEMGGMPLGQGVAGLACKERRTIHIADVSHDPRFITLDNAGTSFRSLLVAPLMMGEKCLGTISLHSNETNSFTPDDEWLLSTLASQAAIAIENAQLFGETKRRLEEMTALYQTSLDITTQLAMPELLKSIVERAVTLLWAEAGGIFLYDQEREELRWVVGYGYAEEYVGITLRPGEGMAGRVFQTGEPLIVEDYRTWEGRAQLYEADHLFTAVLEVPLKWQKQILGVLTITDVRERTFDQDDVWLATLFASQAAIAIENARLYEKVTERMREATVLHRVSNALMRTLNLEQLLENILEVLQAILTVPSCYLTRGQENSA
jgi:GAF domain-containing protein